MVRDSESEVDVWLFGVVGFGSVGSLVVVLKVLYTFGGKRAVILVRIFASDHKESTLVPCFIVLYLVSRLLSLRELLNDLFA